MKFKVLEIDKIMMKNKLFNFVFAQPTNLDQFSDEDYLESQDIENSSKSQGSQMKHMINKS